MHLARDVVGVGDEGRVAMRLQCVGSFVPQLGLSYVLEASALVACAREQVLAERADRVELPTTLDAHEFDVHLAASLRPPGGAPLEPSRPGEALGHRVGRHARWPTTVLPVFVIGASRVRLHRRVRRSSRFAES